MGEPGSLGGGDQNTLMLGEMRGQLREVIHTVNNIALKQDAIATLVIEMKAIPGEFAVLKARVAALEIEKNQRDGAMHLGAWLLKTPLIAWVMAAGAVAYAFLKDRV